MDKLSQATVAIAEDISFKHRFSGCLLLIMNQLQMWVGQLAYCEVRMELPFMH